MRILLLFLTLAFSGELEIEGDLKVSGSIDAQNNPIKNVGIPQTLTDAINGNVLQDALRDDGQYEYTFIMVHLNSPANISDTVQICYSAFKANKCKYYSISSKNSYSILEVAKMFKSKIKYLKPRLGERYASALTKISYNNKIIQKYGKIQLKDYISSFIKTCKL